MECWSRLPNTLYKRWRNPQQSSEGRSEGRRREDQATDNEICTNASGRCDNSSSNCSRRGSDQVEETLTVDDVLETIGFGTFQWRLSLLTGLSWTGDAMEMMILSILGPQLHCEWRLPTYKVALLTSVVFLGMVFGAPVWGNISDKYGRRTGLIMAMSWTLFYGLLSSFAPTYSWLLFLRGLVGFGIGGIPQAATLYLEFLPIKTRGICFSMMSVFWGVGCVFEAVLAVWIMPTLGWRWLLVVSTLPLATFVSLCFWLPESPRFDLLTGNTANAMATLQRVAKDNGKAMPQGKVTAHVQEDRGQIKDLFSPQYWRTTLLLWFIWFVCVFSYYGIILLTTQLFQSGGLCVATQGAKAEPVCNLGCKYLTSDDYKDLLWTTLAEFPGVLIFLLIIDRIGRKTSMALSFFMFSLVLLPLYACIGRVTITIFVFIARAFISGGYQVIYIYTQEVFPTENRALALGACCALSKFGPLIAPFVSEVMLRTSLYLPLSIYCGCSLLAGVFCLVLSMETMGRGLQESNFGGWTPDDHNNGSVKNATRSQE